jgi:tetratricopeptide (TPR) repeat protein
VQHTGVRHEFQTWNNCGPATLSMALSFWGWQGDQAAAAEFTKPNPRDKNVMPYEMAAFVEEQTDFRVVTRVGGDLALVKQFLAAGLPVILEKGFEGPEFSGWMGHYVLVTGYDDTRQEFTTQDSFLGPTIIVGYDVIESFWRAFNFTYLVVYPAEREADVLALLVAQADETINAQAALALASEEIYTQSGRDQFFAWFNRGTNLVALQDYAGAAAAYDEAFALYAALPEEERPWRMMWYQTGPYWAYYYTGRYFDVINLATTTLDAMSEPVLEESYYWRALAREALGDVTGAVEDLQTSLKHHPSFAPSVSQLTRLGVENP